MYNPESYEWRFRSLEYSFLLCPFIGVLGGLFFLMTALYITQDRKAAHSLAKGNWTMFPVFPRQNIVKLLCWLKLHSSFQNNCFWFLGKVETILRMHNVVGAWQLVCVQHERLAWD